MASQLHDTVRRESDLNLPFESLIPSAMAPPPQSHHALLQQHSYGLSRYQDSAVPASTIQNLQQSTSASLSSASYNRYGSRDHSSAKLMLPVGPLKGAYPERESGSIEPEDGGKHPTTPPRPVTPPDDIREVDMFQGGESCPEQLASIFYWRQRQHQHQQPQQIAWEEEEHEPAR